MLSINAHRRIDSARQKRVLAMPTAAHMRPSPDEITALLGVVKAHDYINAEDMKSKDPKKRKPKKLPDTDKAQIVAKRVCIALTKIELEECGAVAAPRKHLMKHIIAEEAAASSEDEEITATSEDEIVLDHLI